MHFVLEILFFYDIVLLVLYILCKIMRKEKKEKILFINLGLLAKLFDAKKKDLSFGIAETISDDCECIFAPIVAINKDTDVYIDLATGVRKKTAYAVGLKETLYKAVVIYKPEDECFQFLMKDARCFISVETLINNFGKECVKLKKF